MPEWLGILVGGIVALVGVAMKYPLDALTYERTASNEQRVRMEEVRRTAYANFLNVVTEIDGIIDLRTPEPGQLGRIQADQETVKILRKNGEEPPQELLTRAQLDVAGVIPTLEELAARAHAASVTVMLVGSTAVANAARELYAAQRSYLVALQQQDAAAVGDVASEARSAIPKFTALARTDLGVQDSLGPPP